MPGRQASRLLSYYGVQLTHLRRRHTHDTVRQLEMAGFWFERAHLHSTQDHGVPDGKYWGKDRGWGGEGAQEGMRGSIGGIEREHRREGGSTDRRSKIWHTICRPALARACQATERSRVVLIPHLHGQCK